MALTFGRILFPSSKPALKEKAMGSLLAEACGLEQGDAFGEEDLPPYAAGKALGKRLT
ncbi:MAG: hypothetical protein AB7T14_04360 [Candidatus Methylacidiphilaceae bacterium]